jgi:Xaa-Pro aminopeptidase
MQDLRVVKAPAEVDLIRRACRISEQAFRRLLTFIRPGVWEFEIEAELVHAFLSNRARRPAFAPIVASGADTCVLHYTQNDKQCRDGDLVLMDFGAEYANYASDLTRTVPVNGRFSPRQRAIYDAVLRIQRAAIDRLRPGNTLAAYQREVGLVAEKEMIALGLLDAREVAAQPADAPLYKKYFMHGTSHHLGLDVHDVGLPGRALDAGMVLTCEPGIYIREEGIGVRIENDILVTSGDPLDLTASVPITADEIEELMAG